MTMTSSQRADASKFEQYLRYSSRYRSRPDGSRPHDSSAPGRRRWDEAAALQVVRRQELGSGFDGVLLVPAFPETGG
jgi:hypothetical protein